MINWRTMRVGHKFSLMIKGKTQSLWLGVNEELTLLPPQMSANHVVWTTFIRGISHPVSHWSPTAQSAW